MMPIARRTIIAGLGGLLAGWLAKIPAINAAEPVVAETARRLAALFAAPKSAAAIGRAYLRTEPEEANAGRLLSQLAPDGRAEALAAMREAELRQLLAARRRADFAAGDTVVLGGWVLARSELRHCALAALAG